VRAKYLLTSALVAGSLLSPISPLPTARAASVVRSVPAGWGYEYAAPAGTRVATSTPTPRAAHDTAQSVFKVTYTGVPANYQPAIQAAVDVWSQNWASTVPVNINANFVKQPIGVLASATPVKYFNNFSGAPDPDLWYPSAMANALAGKDLDPNNPEITIQINSSTGPTLYLGTDGNCPANQYDLESIILHEMAHGLGFLSASDMNVLFGGYGSDDQPTPFDAYAQLTDGTRLMDLPSPSLQLGQALLGPLVWSGAYGVAANGGVKPKLFTPNPYQAGSSVSHLDQATFGTSGANAVMAPNLAPAEIFHQPGPLLLGMMKDMLQKPPAGIPVGVPQQVRNLSALVGDHSAIITFDPPANARVSQVTSYDVKNAVTGEIQTVTGSPVTMSGLRNGVAYSFSVTAKNILGVSPVSTTNGVIPQSPWKATVIDPAADAKYLATGTFQNNPVIAYSDSKTGRLKLATFDGKKWSSTIVDGNATTGGKTTNNVAGFISMCIGTINKVPTLNIFYADTTKKWLRYAGYNGKKWSYSIVDGNGPKVQPYQEKVRVRTASDVSVSSACAVTPSGLQVFYRDESQGILLGAVKDGVNWRYELVDGDSQINGRTTGDVAFHMRATSIGNRVYVLYDSVESVNADKLPIRGAVRVAYRDSAYPEDWQYQVIDDSSNGISVAGFDVGMQVLGKKLSMTWLDSTISPTKPSEFLWADDVSDPTSQNIKVQTIVPTYYGSPTGPLSIDAKGVLFGCQNRLCAENNVDQTITLVSTANFDSSARVEWVTIKGVRYALVGANGQLSLLKAAAAISGNSN